MLGSAPALPPHQHQGHSAAFAPQSRRNFCSSLGFKCWLQDGRGVPHPLPGRGAEKSPAAKALAPAQCGLSPSLVDAAAGEEGLAISPRAMGRWGTSYSLIWNHKEPAPPQQKSRGGLKLASTRPAQTRPSSPLNPVHAAPSCPGDEPMRGVTTCQGQEQPPHPCSQARPGQVTA